MSSKISTNDQPSSSNQAIQACAPARSTNVSSPPTLFLDSSILADVCEKYLLRDQYSFLPTSLRYMYYFQDKLDPFSLVADELLFIGNKLREMVVAEVYHWSLLTFLFLIFAQNRIELVTCAA
jgi:hypothetical protein